MNRTHQTSDKKGTPAIRGGGWALGLGVTACTLVCSLPLVGGSLALSGFLAGLETLGIALVGVGVVSMSVGFYLRRRNRALSSCACGSAAFSVAAKDGALLVCSVTEGQTVVDRVDAFRSVFDRAFVRGERFESHVRWRFRSEPGLFRELQELAILENACCEFFGFELSTHDDEIWWETRTDEENRSMLDFFFELPTRLLEGDDSLDDLKDEFETAGGRFEHVTSVHDSPSLAGKAD